MVHHTAHVLRKDALSLQMNAKRDLSFTFPASATSHIDSWITSCCQFYATSLMDIDPSTASELLTDPLRIRVVEADKQHTLPAFENALEPLSVHVIVQQVLLLGSFS
jgi:hypothetical protein